MTSPSAEDPQRNVDQPIVAAGKKVQKAWGWLLLALSVVTLGVQGHLVKQFQDTVLTVWEVFWLTLPMTAAAAIFAYVLFAGRRITLQGAIAVVMGTLFAVWIVGLGSGESIVDELYRVELTCPITEGVCSVPRPAAGNPIVEAGRIVVTYFQVYGPVRFLSSLLVGTFLGYSVAVFRQET